LSLPLENLDDKTFDELVKEALSRIPIYAPGWTDHNIHDPGITFIELFAWLAEMQIYRLNTIPDRSYRKFLKLMGIPRLKPAIAAEVDVIFSLCNQHPTLIPAGTKVAARDPVSGKDIVFETQHELNVVDAQLKAILSHFSLNGSKEFIDNSEANRNENAYYYAFRYKPKKDDELYLGFNKSLTGEEINLALYFYEVDLYKTGRYGEEKPDVYPSATLIWEYYTGGAWEDDNNWKRLEIRDETRHLTVSGKIWIKIKEEMEQTVINDHDLFWLRCRIEKDGYEIPPKIDFIRLNTVSAIQSNTLEDCKFSSSGLPDFYLDLKHAPVIETTLKVKADDDWSEWSEVEDFDASRPGDTHYTVDSAIGRVTFGDGINGKIPPKREDNIIVSYRLGGGVHGNVEPHAINRVLGELVEEVTVDNEKAASGGEEAEALEDAIHRVKKEMKTVYRAVTSADYEHLAMNTPGLRVARAIAIPRYHPNQDSEVPGIVTVVVVPHSPYAQPNPSAGFLKTVYRYLEKHRLLTTEVFVVPPEYVEVSVDAEVVIKPRYLKGTIEENVRTELGNFLHPITGGPDGNGWPFGRSVYLSEVYEVIDGVEGVDYVKSVSLKKDGKEQEGDVAIPAYGLVFSGAHMISAEEEKEDIHG